MIELVFLGTSASAPSVKRGLSSAMVLHRDRRFLMDCGEGTQRQLLRSGLGFKRLNTILLTHGHLDHILGLGGLISTFARWEAIDQVDIYGGHWALERVRALMEVVFGTGEPPYPIQYHPVRPGVVLEYDELTITAFPVQHRGPGCFGYCFEERERRPFLVDRAEALGVPPGPERAMLVRGEPVRLASGRLVRPEDVLGPPKPGARLAFVGDAGNTGDLLDHVRGATTLVIEATYLESERDLARRFGHITAAEAATLARNADVGSLILTHISRRHSDSDVLAEAQAIFPQVAVARDFDVYRVPAPE
ncbi:MAG: ribonuclease Z [Anaerolineae bacterium]|nr:ribonuclease Z [Anaerolineae bacterium]